MYSVIKPDSQLTIELRKSTMLVVVCKMTLASIMDYYPSHEDLHMVTSNYIRSNQEKFISFTQTCTLRIPISTPYI